MKIFNFTLIKTKDLNKILTQASQDSARLKVAQKLLGREVTMYDVHVEGYKSIGLDLAERMDEFIFNEISSCKTTH